MKIKIVEPKQVSFKEKVLVVPFLTGTKKIKIGNRKMESLVEKALTQSVPADIPKFCFLDKQNLVLFNLGKEKEWSQRKFLLSIRKIIRSLSSMKTNQAILLLDHLSWLGEKEKMVDRVIVNIYLANYEFDRYKRKKGKQIESIEIVIPKAQKYAKASRRGEIIGQAVNFARDLTNMPGSDMNPKEMARIAKRKARPAYRTDRQNKLAVEIFNEQKIKKLKLNGLLAVAQGSKQKPKLIILKYKGNKSKKVNLLFIGKGVTFDSGGLNIKTGEKMDEMWMDMEGAAVVMGAIFAISKLNLPINVVAVAPVVENIPSSKSYHPGDIIKMYSGKTVEVSNTDAEGRLILADALSYGIKRFKPQITVDAATLTMAAVNALGKRRTAIFTNQDSWENILRKIGDDSGDYVWPLPCTSEYEQDIKGKVGEISNVGKNSGGAIMAAMFLKNFVDNLPWIHLDIAPTMVSIENQGLAKGATGAGVKYLIELAKNFKRVINEKDQKRSYD